MRGVEALEIPVDDFPRMNNVSQNTSSNMDSELIAPKDIPAACAHEDMLENVQKNIFSFSHDQ